MTRCTGPPRLSLAARSGALMLGNAIGASALALPRARALCAPCSPARSPGRRAAARRCTLSLAGRGRGARRGDLANPARLAPRASDRGHGKVDDLPARDDAAIASVSLSLLGRASGSATRPCARRNSPRPRSGAHRQAAAQRQALDDACFRELERRGSGTWCPGARRLGGRAGLRHPPAPRLRQGCLGAARSGRNAPAEPNRPTACSPTGSPRGICAGPGAICSARVADEVFWLGRNCRTGGGDAAPRSHVCLRRYLSGNRIDADPELLLDIVEIHAARERRPGRSRRRPASATPCAG